MKIIETKNKNGTRLAEISDGTAFQCDGDYYIKTDERDPNNNFLITTRIRSGYIHRLDPETLVTPLPSATFNPEGDE